MTGQGPRRERPRTLRGWETLEVLVQRELGHHWCVTCRRSCPFVVWARQEWVALLGVPLHAVRTAESASTCCGCGQAFPAELPLPTEGVLPALA